MIMSNKLYDILVWIAQILLPALAALYAALAGTWGIPLTEQIVASIAAIDVFLGALLKVSQKKYYNKINGKDSES